MLLPVVRLAAIRRRQMIGRGCDAVLGENAVLDGHLAFAARLLTAANGLDLDAEHACGIEQVCAGRDLALAAGRLKNDSAGSWVCLLAHRLGCMIRSKDMMITRRLYVKWGRMTNNGDESAGRLSTYAANTLYFRQFKEPEKCSCSHHPSCRNDHSPCPSPRSGQRFSLLGRIDLFGHAFATRSEPRVGMGPF